MLYNFQAESLKPASKSPSSFQLIKEPGLNSCNATVIHLLHRAGLLHDITYHRAGNVLIVDTSATFNVTFSIPACDDVLPARFTASQ